MTQIFATALGNWCRWIGASGSLLLVFTPGAWLTFGLGLGRFPFWARLFIAAMLSPLVVGVEFYVIRLAGAPFGATSVLLVILNLPAIHLMWRHRVSAAVDAVGWLVAASVVAIPAVIMFPLLIRPETRIFAPHGWIHADVLYMFARGYLIPEDPTLAGLRLSYPVWGPMVFQAVQSFLVNSPPIICYVWTNLLWLIVFCGFAAGITKELGGGGTAQFVSGIWLLFGTTAGTDAVGHILRKVAPGSIGYFLWDSRYVHAFTKFQISGPMALALGMLSAITYVLVRDSPLTKGLWGIVCLLVLGVGLLYPLLFPPGCAIVGARALATLADPQTRRGPFPYKELLAWAALLFIAALLTYTHVRFLTSDRQVPSSPILFSSPGFAAKKLIGSVAATSLFLAGWAFTFAGSYKVRRRATLLLSGGALAGYILNSVFDIPYYANEYKFVFASAICLAAFPAIAMERIWREWPQVKRLPVFVATAILFVGSYSHYSYTYWPVPWMKLAREEQKRPLVDARQFHLKLDPREPWAGICNAVREMTPANTIVVLNDSALYYPAFFSRSLYVSAADKLYPGVTLFTDDISADVRGYGRQILAERRATVADIFDASDSSRTEHALGVILELGRPVAIVVEPRHAKLLEWLQHRKTATQLYGEGGMSLWLVAVNRDAAR